MLGSGVTYNETVPKSIKQSLGASADNHKLFIILLTPSWLSGLVAVVASLAVMVTTVMALHFPGSSLQLLLDDHKGNTSPSLSTGSLAVSNNFSSNQLINDIPLFVLWGCVGLLVYSLIISTANTLGGAGELMAELNFTHVKRWRLLGQELGRLLIRVIVLVGWVLFTEITVHTILPYVIALTQFASSAVGVMNTVLDAALAFVVLTACLHLHVILLRLLMLKPRLFGQTDYV